MKTESPMQSTLCASMPRCLCAFLFCVFVLLCLGNSSAQPKTNVVFILTDNHGAWTLGCYGNPDIKTPNIDRLAAQGVRFAQAFANNPVCSPTRASYLTGLMPSQHGIHSFLSGGRWQTGPDARNTLEEFTSLPEILKAEGYRCGLVGKWHLGANESPQEGLDDYWITMPHGGTSTFHGARVIENGETRVEPKYLTDLWTEHALKFIEQSKDNPFFLYLAYNGPYGLSRYQLQSSGNKHEQYYADKPMDSFPRGAIHPWQYSNREYFGNMTSIRRYGEELSAIDDGVGAVMKKLEDSGIAGKTLVIFAADQGWAGGQHGLWGMGDHTRPVNAREYSMQIPMIFRHRAKGPQSAPGIPGGQVSELMVSNYDFLPSVLHYLGLGDKVPGGEGAPPATRLPGRDFSPVLRGEKIPDWEDAVYYEYEGLRCVRAGGWKYVERYGDGYDELYNLGLDPGERVNLVGQAEYGDKETELKAKLAAFFAAHAAPKYDLWKGGESQTRLHDFGKESAARHAARATKYRRMPSVLDPEVDVPPMRLPRGLVAEVAAAPPLTRYPMMAEFDERGRLFVAEAAGVNLKAQELDEQTPNFIRLLVDSNGDGLFDKSTVFADKLTFPSGVLWHQGALWVTASPHIWRFEDSDDDGVADRREAIVSGFGYTGNAADLHGPFLHPNGRIFWAHGRKDLDVHDKEGNPIHKGIGARIWSCEPDGSDVQIYAGGGMDNPVEVCFTPEGELIGDVNLFYGRPRGDVLVHWQYGGAYPRYDREDVLAEFTRTGDLLPEFYNFGHVAVSGMTRYRTPGGIAGEAGDLFISLF
ncbi:MAG: PVC-type heme-binding CxxCH protein, partial [Verrucomicrobiales bacterium]